MTSFGRSGYSEGCWLLAIQFPKFHSLFFENALQRYLLGYRCVGHVTYCLEVLKYGSAADQLLRLWVRIPPRSMNVCLLLVLCVVTYVPLRRADHSSRGVQPSVVRRCVRGIVTS